MQKIKAISLVGLGAVMAILASNFLQPALKLDKQVIELPISETVSIEGFRNNSGGATVGFQYYYFIRDVNDERQKPFLVTDSEQLEFNVLSDTSFTVSVKGNIYQFTNLVWADDGEQLTALDISLEAHKP